MNGLLASCSSSLACCGRFDSREEDEENGRTVICRMATSSSGSEGTIPGSSFVLSALPAELGFIGTL